jgi:hypothetical protein
VHFSQARKIRALRARAVALLENVEIEDATVAEFNRLQFPQ